MGTVWRAIKIGQRAGENGDEDRKDCCGGILYIDDGEALGEVTGERGETRGKVGLRERSLLSRTKSRSVEYLRRIKMKLDSGKKKGSPSEKNIAPLCSEESLDSWSSGLKLNSISCNCTTDSCERIWQSEDGKLIRGERFKQGAIANLVSGEGSSQVVAQRQEQRSGQSISERAGSGSLGSGTMGSGSLGSGGERDCHKFAAHERKLDFISEKQRQVIRGIEVRRESNSSSSSLPPMQLKVRDNYKLRDAVSVGSLAQPSGARYKRKLLKTPCYLNPQPSKGSSLPSICSENPDGGTVQSNLLALSQKHDLWEDGKARRISMAKLVEDNNVLMNIRKRELVHKKLDPDHQPKGLAVARLARKSRIFGAPAIPTLLMPSLNTVGETAWGASVFATDCLAWHNMYRARHGVQPLVMDRALCETAQNWANLLAHTNEFYYQNPPELGENLLAWPVPVMPPSSVARPPPDVTGEHVTNYWYRKNVHFPYGKDPNVLHSYASQFTQLIWAETSKFGCGKARSGTGKVFVVAYYSVKGNIPGQFHINVKELKNKESSSLDN